MASTDASPEKAGVGGSIPSLATILRADLALFGTSCLSVYKPELGRVSTLLRIFSATFQEL